MRLWHYLLTANVQVGVPIPPPPITLFPVLNNKLKHNFSGEPGDSTLFLLNYTLENNFLHCVSNSLKPKKVTVAVS